MSKTDDIRIPPAALNNLLWTIHLLDRKMGLSSLRFQSRPGLAFPCKEVESIKRVETRDGILCEVQTNLGGLDGISGPLPPWLNDILSCEDSDSAPLGDFFNIFSHRFIECLYLEWMKYRRDISYRADCRDPISKILFALLGIRLMTEMSAPCQREELHRASLLPYIGTLGHRPRSAAGLQGMLKDFFSPVDINVKEFVLRKVTIPVESRAYIDGRSVQLGKNSVIGEQVRDISGSFRVVVGPVNWMLFMAFLPEGKQFRQLMRLLEIYVSELLIWDFAIRIKGKSIPQILLSTTEEKQPQLGYNAWLISIPRKDDEIIFNPRIDKKGFRK